jgi:hypothetical protein
MESLAFCPKTRRVLKVTERSDKQLKPELFLTEHSVHPLE